MIFGRRAKTKARFCFGEQGDYVDMQHWEVKVVQAAHGVKSWQ